MCVSHFSNMTMHLLRPRASSSPSLEYRAHGKGRGSGSALPRGRLWPLRHSCCYFIEFAWIPCRRRDMHTVSTHLLSVPPLDLSLPRTEWRVCGSYLLMENYLDIHSLFEFYGWFLGGGVDERYGKSYNWNGKNQEEMLMVEKSSEGGVYRRFFLYRVGKLDWIRFAPPFLS